MTGVSSDQLGQTDVAGGMMGQLTATRLALWEAVDRLPETDRDEMRQLLSATMSDLRATWSQDPSSHQAEFLDELEFVTHRMRYHTGRTLVEGEPSGEYAAVCMKCDKFPLDFDEPCPECGSRRFLDILRV